MVCEYDACPDHDGPCRPWLGSALVAKHQPLEAAGDDLEASGPHVPLIGDVALMRAGEDLDADLSVVRDAVHRQELPELAHGQDAGFVRHEAAPYRSEP